MKILTREKLTKNENISNNILVKCKTVCDYLDAHSLFCMWTSESCKPTISFTLRLFMYFDALITKMIVKIGDSAIFMVKS